VFDPIIGMLPIIFLGSTELSENIGQYRRKEKNDMSLDRQSMIFIADGALREVFEETGIQSSVYP
jgi:8-oxo-dGTP pyrophosphatase MutT (NUDIX family)